MVPGAHEVVARRLARRIRAVRLVGVGLAERRVVVAERAVDLVGRDVQEAERRCSSAVELVQCARAASSSVKVPCTLVRMKSAGPVDAAVDVALGREVHDGARPVRRRAGRRAARRSQMSPCTKTWRASPCERGQVLGVAGVGEGVEVEHRLAAEREPVEDEVGADEAGAAGDEDHRGSAESEGRPRPADARVVEAGGARAAGSTMLRPSTITVPAHRRAHRVEVDAAEFLPLGDDDQRVGAAQRIASRSRRIRCPATSAEDAPRLCGRDRVVGADRGAALRQLAHDRPGSAPRACRRCPA